MSAGPVASLISPEVLAATVEWRRHLHQLPELAYKERHTADFVAAQLAQAGLSVHRGLAGTGVVGTLTRGTSRRAIAIRADMDALPIQEQSGVPHASTVPGVMHACGHDGHVAMALAAAQVCAQLADLDGTVHFIFQPAEEGERGAGKMIEDGLFRLFPCDAVYGLHNWPDLPVGTCIANDGAMMAATAIFDIDIRGRGCHGAMPHEGVDPIVAGCHTVTSLHSIVSRNVDPMRAAVISVTQVSAGHAFNVIPEHCSLRGTARWFANDVGNILEQRIREIASSIPAAFGCEAYVHYERRFPATINTPEHAAIVRRVAANVGLDARQFGPSMGSEDFAFMLEACPGCYFWLGGGAPEGSPGLHSPRYDFNDAIIPHGVRLWVALVQHSLRAS